jgi:hypothetical protein
MKTHHAPATIEPTEAAMSDTGIDVVTGGSGVQPGLRGRPLPAWLAGQIRPCQERRGFAFRTPDTTARPGAGTRSCEPGRILLAGSLPVSGQITPTAPWIGAEQVRGAELREIRWPSTARWCRCG